MKVQFTGLIISRFTIEHRASISGWWREQVSMVPTGGQTSAQAEAFS